MRLHTYLAMESIFASFRIRTCRDFLNSLCSYKRAAEAKKIRSDSWVYTNNPTLGYKPSSWVYTHMYIYIHNIHARIVARNIFISE